MNIFKRVDWLAVFTYPLAVVLMEAFWIFPWLMWIGLWPMFAELRPALNMLSVIIVLAMSLMATRVATRRRWPLWLIRAVVIGGGFVTMFLVIRFDYGNGYALFDGQWFSYIGQMLGATFDKPYPVVLALPVLLYLWWRGIQLGRTTSYFDNIYRSFVIGMVALIALIVFWQITSGRGDFEGPISTIGLYVIAFFFFGLTALAICHLYLMRRRMADKEVVTSVWRSLPIMLGVIGSIIAIGFISASLFSPEFFKAIGRGVGVVFKALGTAVEYILIPFNFLFEAIFWLIQWFLNLIRNPEAQELEGGGGSPFEGIESTSAEIPQMVTTILQWLVIAVIIAVVVFILARAISRFRVGRDREEIEEIHESLWSMSGLRDDLRLLFNMMGQKFKRKPKPAAAYYDDESGRLSVREIYQRLQWEAAQSGIIRRRYETPCEYEGRLQKYVPDGVEQLAQITDLYSEVRYGEIEPRKEQVDTANGLWPTLRGLLRRIRGA